MGEKGSNVRNDADGQKEGWMHAWMGVGNIVNLSKALDWCYLKVMPFNVGLQTSCLVLVQLLLEPSEACKLFTIPSTSVSFGVFTS
eukprot:3744465-Amphidinium_carterae.1